MSANGLDRLRGLAKIIENLGKYKEMLEHEEIPLEIVAMEVNPEHCTDAGLLMIAFGPKFARPSSGLEYDESRYIVQQKS